MLGMNRVLVRDNVMFVGQVEAVGAGVVASVVVGYVVDVDGGVSVEAIGEVVLEVALVVVNYGRD